MCVSSQNKCQYIHINKILMLSITLHCFFADNKLQKCKHIFHASTVIYSRVLKSLQGSTSGTKFNIIFTKK